MRRVAERHDGVAVALLGLLLAAWTTAPLRADVRVRVMRVGDMTVARQQHSATLLSDGRVLITGGFTVGGPVQDRSAEIFDPVNATFTRVAPMNVARADHVSALLADGRVLVAGGFRASYVLVTETAEVWDPRTETFRSVGPMSVPRARPSVAHLPDGRVAVLGGRREGVHGTATERVDAFDASTETFAPLAPLLLARQAGATCDLGGGRVLLIGGDYRCCSHPWNLARAATMEFCDVTTGTCALLETIPRFRLESIGSSAVLADGRCLVDDGQTAALIAEDGQVIAPAWHLPTRERASLIALDIGTVLRVGQRTSVLDLGSGLVVQEIAEIAAEDALVTHLRDGRWLVTGGRGIPGGYAPLRGAWLIEVERSKAP